jgi:CheY-like chemotaxis protein
MSRTILVVEDSKSVRTALRWALNKSGDTVVTATGFDEGQGHDVPDIALVDYHLPDGSSADLAKHFKDAGAATIVIAGNYHDFNPATYEAVGVHHILRKPFKSQDVLDVIEAAVSGEKPEPVAADSTEETAGPPSPVPPPPPADDEEPAEERTARGTMALKGMPRPTADEDEETTAKPEAPAASEAKPTPRPDAEPATVGDGADEAQEEPLSAPEKVEREPAPPTATTAPEETDVEPEKVAKGAEVAADRGAAKEPASKPAAAPAAVDKEEIREMVQEIVQQEVSRAVDGLIQDGLETKLPGMVKNAIREMLRDELNKKVVAYAKKKIDAFSAKDLPRIAERVLQKKSEKLGG